MNWYKQSQPCSPRLGQCYVLSGRYVLNNSNAILVHGTINGIRFTGKDFDNLHAWVEEGDEVFDPVLDKRFPKDMYYEVMNAKSHKKYDQEKMMVIMLREGHWGPWE